MQIFPSSPMTRYIKGVELNGQSINATFIDMATGRVQYWNAGSLVEDTGEVRILLESHAEIASLDPQMSNELDALLDQAKRYMATLSPEEREAMFEEQKASLARGFTKMTD